MSSSDEEEASVRRKREDTGCRREDDDDALPERKVEIAREENNADIAAPGSERVEKPSVAETAASEPPFASPSAPIKEEPLNASAEESAVAEGEAAKVTSSEIEDGPAPSSSSPPPPPPPCDQRVPDQNATTATTLATIKTEVRDSIESEAAAAAAAALTGKEEPEAVCAAAQATHVPEEVERDEEEEESSELNTAAVPDVESDLKLLCAETLLTFSTRSVEVIEEVEDKDAGLELLAEGVAIREREEGAWCGGCDVLRRVTRADAKCYGVHGKSINWSRMDISLLQTVTAYEYQQQVNWVDPMSRLRVRYDHHQYSSAESETRCRNYIANKMKQKEVSFDAEGNQVIVEDEYMGIKSLAAVIKKIKNTEIMSQLEVDLRAQLVQLQSLHRDKQKEMARLKASPRKRTGSRSSSSSRQQRGPGRPKKRKLKSSSSKTKMGRPRKGSTNSKQQLPVIEEEKEEGEDNEGGGCEGGTTGRAERAARAAEESDEEYDDPEEEMDDEGEEEEEFEDEEENAEEELDVDDLPPPVLEPCEPPSTPKQEEEEEEEEQQQQQQPPNPFANLTSAFGAPSSRSSSGLLKPPKLTASLSPPGAGGGGGKSANDVTNLSTISARFMKGRSNPFANLMKLASGPESSRASSKHKDDEDDAEGDNEESDDENENEERERDGGSGNGRGKPGSASEDELEDELSSKGDQNEAKSASKRAPSDLSSAEDSAGCSSSKKRKSDKPRKHMGATETIVPKQSKNLFMMNCVNLQRGFKSTSAEAARALSNSSKDKEDEYDFTEDDEASTVNASPGLNRIKQAKIFSDYRSSPTFGTAAAAAVTESVTKGEGKTKKKRRSEEGTWKTSTSTGTSPKTSTPRRRSTGGEKDAKKEQEHHQQQEQEQQQPRDTETPLAKPQKPPPPQQQPQQPIKCGTESDSSNEY